MLTLQSKFEVGGVTTFSFIGLILGFLLLVTMMVMTPYIVTHTYTMLPQASTALPVRQASPTLGIDPRGTFWIYDGSGWERFRRDELSERLTHLYENSRERVLHIEADVRRPYEEVLHVLDVAQALGVSEIILLAECPRGTESLRSRCRA